MLKCKILKKRKKETIADSNTIFSILYFNSLSVAPEQFQIIVLAVFAIEDMDNHIYKIKQYPSSLFIAGKTEPDEPSFLCQIACLVGDSPHLPVACAGSYNKIIGSL